MGDGTWIHWSEVGDGPPVVLVHGLTESAPVWDPIVERLAGDHRVITLDLRGHGRSARPASGDYGQAALSSDLAAVLDAAEVGAAPHLVGHSLGGLVVAADAAARPVASVVVVDQPLRLAGKRRLRALRRPDQEVVLGVWSFLLEAPPAEIEAVIDRAITVDPAVAHAVVPHLTLLGTAPDPDYPSWLARRIPGAVVEVWDGHGHYPHLVDPDRFTARLRALWAAGQGSSSAAVDR